MGFSSSARAVVRVQKMYIHGVPLTKLRFDNRNNKTDPSWMK